MSTIDLKPSKTNGDYCKRRVDELDKDKLIHDLLALIDKLGKKRRYKLPLWSYVGEATNHGSGVSSTIVARFYPEYRDA